MMIGKQAEYLACAELLSLGLYPSLAGGALPYDILLDTGDKILKLQIKSVSKSNIIKRVSNEYHFYTFNLRRCSKYNSKNYNDDIDIFGLVCTETKEVGFITRTNLDIIQFKIDKFRGTYYNEIINAERHAIFELSKTMSNKQISETLQMDMNKVKRATKLKNYMPSVRYFSEIFRTKDWFIDNF